MSPAPDARRARAADTLAHALASAADLSARLERSETALAHAQEQIGQTSRLLALGRVASGVAHDVNNSLTTILGLSDWLLHELPSHTPYYTDLQSIRAAAQDAAAMVKRLQQFGRMQPDPSRPSSFDTLDLGEVLRAVADLTRARCQELGLQAACDFDVAVDATPGLLVRGAAGQVRELLANLVFNGLDAMPHGGTVRLTARLCDGRPAVLVADSGVGMSDDVKARMFEPFYSTKSGDGRGLGLNVCATIAERHDAELTVDTAPGAGTTVVVAFPPHVPDAQRPAGARPAPAARSLSVLVVDDQPGVCDSLAAMVSALGHSVAKALDGATALDQVIARRFDVVITDLAMPGMNGLELARGVRACRPSTGVVLLTAWDAELGGDASVSDVLVVSKPVTMDGLRECLAAAAERRPGSGGLHLVYSSEAGS